MLLQGFEYPFFSDRIYLRMFFTWTLSSNQKPDLILYQRHIRRSISLFFPLCSAY